MRARACERLCDSVCARVRDCEQFPHPPHPTLPCTVSAECLKGKGLTSGAAAGLLAHKFGGVDEADVGPTIEQLF